MFTTVLWATDASDAASRALPLALTLVRESGGSLVVGHVEELIVGRAGGYPVYADEPDIRERLQMQVEELQNAGIDAKLEIRTCLGGHVGATLTAIAADVRADVIVVGTHGHTRVGQFFVGSITQQLLLGSYPVLAVPSRTTSEAERQLAEVHARQ